MAYKENLKSFLGTYFQGKKQEAQAAYLGWSAAALSRYLDPTKEDLPLVSTHTESYKGLEGDAKLAFQKLESVLIEEREEARRKKKQGKDEEKRPNDSLPTSYELSTVTLPNYMTVRSILSDLVETVEELPTDKRILEIIGSIGDGTAYMAKVLVDALRDRNNSGRRSGGFSIMEVSLQGFWLRRNALSKDSFPGKFTAGLVEDLAEDILLQLQLPSPRGHVQPSSEEKAHPCLNKLVDYLANKPAKRGERLILAIHDFWPGDAQKRENETVISQIFLHLIDNISKGVENILILIAVPQRLNGDRVESRHLERMPKEDVRRFAEETLTLDPDIVDCLMTYIDTRERDDNPEHRTVDEWALILGNLQDEIKKDDNGLEKFREFWTDIAGNFETETILKTRNDQWPQSDKNVKQIIKRLPATDKPAYSVLLLASLFPDTFSAGDIVRLFRIVSLKPENRISREYTFWKERGQIREYLHQLNTLGWIYMDSQPGEHSLRYRYRPSLLHALKETWDAELLKEAKEAYCWMILNNLEGNFFKGLFFTQNISEPNRHLNIFYIGAKYAIDTKQWDALYYISLKVCYFFVAEANWHLAIEWLENVIKNYTVSGMMEEWQNEYLKLLYFSYSFHSDDYKVINKERQILGVLNSDEKKILDNEEVNGKLSTDIRYFDDPELNQGIYYWLFGIRCLYEARRENIKNHHDPSNKENDSFEKAKRYIDKSIEMLKNAKDILISCRKAYAENEKSGAKYFEKNGLQAGIHINAVEASRSLGLAYYWKAKIYAQMDCGWRENKKEKEKLRKLFLKSIGYAQDNECYRELVFSLIWLARIEVLYKGEVGEIAFDRQSLQDADRHLIHASSFSTSTKDKKVINMLQFHRELIQIKKEISKSGDIKAIVYPYSKPFDGVFKEYDLMGEKYWKSFALLIASTELYKAKNGKKIAVDYFKQAVKLWKDIIRYTEEAEVEILPEVLFLDLMTDCKNTFSARGENDIKEESAKVDEWNAKRKPDLARSS